MSKWICKEYSGVGWANDVATGQTQGFDTEEAAVAFYQDRKSAQRFAGNAYSPYWGYPVKVEA